MFKPAIYLSKITRLRGDMLAAHGIRGLILDIDNTLTTHNNPVPDPEILNWLREIESSGIALILLSNNSAGRVEPFSRILKLSYTANAKKPLPGGFARAAKALGLSRGEVAVVGDQIFTDILGGNIFGAKTIFVEPIEPENIWYFRLKRLLERGILKKYRSQGETE